MYILMLLRRLLLKRRPRPAHAITGLVLVALFASGVSAGAATAATTPPAPPPAATASAAATKATPSSAASLFVMPSRAALSHTAALPAAKIVNVTKSKVTRFPAGKLFHYTAFVPKTSKAAAKRLDVARAKAHVTSRAKVAADHPGWTPLGAEADSTLGGSLLFSVDIFGRNFKEGHPSEILLDFRATPSFDEKVERTYIESYSKLWRCWDKDLSLSAFTVDSRGWGYLIEAPARFNTPDRIIVQVPARGLLVLAEHEWYTDNWFSTMWMHGDFYRHAVAHITIALGGLE